MQAIKSKDTKIECILRKRLWDLGYRYRKNYKKLIGKPDIVLTKFERPKDQSEAVKTKRASYGQYFYDKYNR